MANDFWEIIDAQKWVEKIRNIELLRSIKLIGNWSYEKAKELIEETGIKSYKPAECVYA